MRRFAPCRVPGVGAVILGCGDPRLVFGRPRFRGDARFRIGAPFRAAPFVLKRLGVGARFRLVALVVRFRRPRLGMVVGVRFRLVALVARLVDRPGVRGHRACLLVALGTEETTCLTLCRLCSPAVSVPCRLTANILTGPWKIVPHRQGMTPMSLLSPITVTLCILLRWKSPTLLRASLALWTHWGIKVPLVPAQLNRCALKLCDMSRGFLDALSMWLRPLHTLRPPTLVLANPRPKSFLLRTWVQSPILIPHSPLSPPSWNPFLLTQPTTLLRHPSPRTFARLQPRNPRRQPIPLSLLKSHFTWPSALYGTLLTGTLWAPTPYLNRLLGCTPQPQHSPMLLWEAPP